MRTWLLVTLATLLSVAFVVVLHAPGLSPFSVTVISNGGQLLAAIAAAAGCAVAASRRTGRRQHAWWLLSAGTGSWAGGQAVWSYYEVVLDREVPFPSLADIGFLAFPLVAGAGLVIWMGSRSDELVARGRDVMDGAIIAASLLVLSWVTVMATVVEQGLGGDRLLARPVARLPRGRRHAGHAGPARPGPRCALRTRDPSVLAAGLGGFALADSAFVYLTSNGTYSSADLVSSSGWVVGFLFVGAAGLSAGDPGAATDTCPYGPPGLQLTLPLPPAARRGCRALRRPAHRGQAAAPRHRARRRAGVHGAGPSVPGHGRQPAAADRPRRGPRPARAPGAARLAHRVCRTGSLFADRLDRALLQPSASVSVLFCDLDDFKLVNDNLGHEAGDDLLQLVASRLLECVRATDTVARLGGDEFAILLDDSSDAVSVADRIVASMNEEVEVLGKRCVRRSASGSRTTRAPRRRPPTNVVTVGRGAGPSYGGRHRPGHALVAAARGDRRPAAAARGHALCTPPRGPGRVVPSWRRRTAVGLCRRRSRAEGRRTAGGARFPGPRGLSHPRRCNAGACT